MTKRIRYLSMLLMLLSSIGSLAQDWNPADPAEPGQLTTKLILSVSPSEIGIDKSVLYYLPGEEVTVSASSFTKWDFANWTDGDGNVVATTPEYTFTKGAKTEMLTANYVFNPGVPGDPFELPHRLTLVADPEKGGGVSGEGLYLSGTTVGINASAYDGYEFTGWYNADGTCYATDASTTVTMGHENVTLTARFQFNPASPREPGQVNKWLLRLVAHDGGTVTPDKTYLSEGETVSVRAAANGGYVFTGWYEDGVQVSEIAELSYTMPDRNVTLEARFEFSPDNPFEPDYIKQRTFSFTLYNVITKPGATAQFPILLTPRATLGDITLQLNFDPRLGVDIDNVIVGETTTPYTKTCEAVTDGPTYDAGYTSYRFTLTGGSMVVGENETPTVTPILTFPVVIPADIETAAAYKITINQISITNEDGTTQTAGTRNGRLSVYKNGDANGDNEVSIIDAVSVVDCILGNRPDDFIEEAANTNDDEGISIIDAVGVVDIILGEDGGESRQETKGQQASSEPE